MNRPAISIQIPVKRSFSSFASSARKAAPSPSSRTILKSLRGPRAASKFATARSPATLIPNFLDLPGTNELFDEPLQRHHGRLQGDLGAQIPLPAHDARHHSWRV